MNVVAASHAFASVSWDSVRPLLVTASAIRSRWPSRAWRETLPTGVVAVPDAAWNVSASGVIRTPRVELAAVMPWIKMAAAVLPMTSPRSPVAC